MPAFRAWGLAERAEAFSNMGNKAQAQADAEEAIHFNPAASSSYSVLGRLLRRSGKLNEALTASQEAVAIRPTNFFALHQVALALTALGRHKEAVKWYTEACQIARSQETCADLSVGLLNAGRRDEASRAAERAAAMADTGYGPYNLACYWALAGDTGKALGFLQRALAVGFSDIHSLEQDSDLTSLHGSPKFKRIVEEVRKRVKQE
jgi:tetratricopeptide (TPR) repeat protein